MKSKKSLPSESDEDDAAVSPETIIAFDSTDEEDNAMGSTFIGNYVVMFLKSFYVVYILYEDLWLVKKLGMARKIVVYCIKKNILYKNLRISFVLINYMSVGDFTNSW